MSKRISPELRQRIIDAFNATHSEDSFADRLVYAFKSCGTTPPKENRRFPSSFPWLGVAKRYSHTPDRGTAKATRPAPKVVSTSLASALDDALNLLSDALVTEIVARVEARLTNQIAKAAVCRAGAPPAAAPRSATESRQKAKLPNQMTDDELRAAITDAKKAENYIYAAKLIDIIKKRDIAANTIGREDEA